MRGETPNYDPNKAPSRKKLAVTAGAAGALALTIGLAFAGADGSCDPQTDPGCPTTPTDPSETTLVKPPETSTTSSSVPESTTTSSTVPETTTTTEQPPVITTVTSAPPSMPPISVTVPIAETE